MAEAATGCAAACQSEQAFMCKRTGFEPEPRASVPACGGTSERPRGMIAAGSVGGIWTLSLRRVASPYRRIAVALSIAVVVLIGAFELPLAPRGVRIAGLVLAIAFGAFGYQFFIRTIGPRFDDGLRSLARLVSRARELFR
jgi:hypothetical protein